MIVSGIYGPEVWGLPIASYLPIVKPYVSPQTSFKDLWVVFLLGAFFIAHLPECVYNVAKARRAQGLPLAPVFLEWTPIIVFSTSCMAWLGSPHSTLLPKNHLLLFCLTMSLVFGRMTTKIILAHLTKQPFPYWTVMLVPLIGGAVLANGPPLLGFKPVGEWIELQYLRGYFVFALIVYSRWAVLVINAICSYLGINCLTIPRDKLQKARAEQRGEKPGPEKTNGVAIGGRKKD